MTAPTSPNTSLETPPGVIRHRQRVLAVDWQWIADVGRDSFSDHVFTRSSAKGRTFTGTDFRYSIFDACYFRNCTFDSCDFTGCRFVATNFHGSTFSGCKFDYAFFERTHIDSSILDTGCPAFENLKLRFARTLRTNFQSLGDAAAVNKAILVELDATEIHLHKAWRSNEAYYRRKYKGLQRLTAYAEWLKFKVLDLLWGNGERPGRLVRFVILVLIGIAVGDVFVRSDPRMLQNYLSGSLRAPQIFLGITSPFGGLTTAGVAFTRLVIFGLFISILVRRFTRR